MLTASDFVHLGGSSLQAVHGLGAGRKGSSGRLERSTDTKQGGGKQFHTVSEPNFSTNRKSQNSYLSQGVYIYILSSKITRL